MNKTPPQENPSNQQSQDKFNAYIKYSGLAAHMMIIIAGGAYGGFRLDKYLAWKIPVFTIVLSLLSVVLAIWYAVKDLLK